jgi:hypothetical protein
MLTYPQDLVAYRVDEVSPFRVTRVTRPSGGACGATCVDHDFLNIFLRRRLGDSLYDRLMRMGIDEEPHGQGAHTVLRIGQKIMLAGFMPLKHSFAGRLPNGNEPGPSVLDLPDNISKSLPPQGIIGIHNGSLQISWYGNIIRIGRTKVRANLLQC